jgi:hypothetical protein
MWNKQAPSCSVTVIAVAPDAMRYAMAAFVPGDLAGRAWPISTSAIAMGV